MSAPSDYETLGMCEATIPCHATLAQLAEATPYIDHDGFTCIMNALAARTPGLYRYENDSTNTFSSTGTDYVLLVTEDGSVLYAAQGTYSSATEPMQRVTPKPTARCQLKPASYFESCIEALASRNSQPNDPAWACAYGELRSSWLEQCEDASITACE